MLIVHYHLVQLPRIWKIILKYFQKPTNRGRRTNFGYENNSDEVRPNSSIDLNLIGMNNSHSSEWDLLIQYKSTHWKKHLFPGQKKIWVKSIKKILEQLADLFLKLTIFLPEYHCYEGLRKNHFRDFYLVKLFVNF